MRVAVAQFNPTIGDLKGNGRKIKEFISLARQEGVELIIFPELAVTGYPPRDLLLYDAFLDQVQSCIEEEILPCTYGLSVLLGAPWKEGGSEGRLFNTAFLLKNGSVLFKQPKTLLPNYGVFDERRYFTPAAKRRPLTIEGLKVAVTICEDIWNDKDFWERRLYEEDPVEDLFRQGAELLINISASPYHLQKAGQRSKMLCALAKKYKAGVIYANQVGGNDELIFDGSSMICSSAGHLLYQAPPFQEILFSFDTEELQEASGGLQKIKEIFLPQGISLSPEFIAGMRAEEGINWLYAALRLGLADYLRKTGFKDVVIGLSGGIDSAVTAALAVSALGPERVLGVLMPSRYSSAHSLEDAQELADNLKIKTLLLPIEGPFRAFLELMNEVGEPRGDLAEENIQARIRGAILMFISNREGRLVLTTGNKSELAVGYCTLYGDMSGGLGVLADVPKTEVYRLAEYINELAGYAVIPQRVLEKAPSAELRPNQRDQDSLPPYELLDRILHYYIEENKHIKEISFLGFEEKLVGEVVDRVDRAEYKRFQAAPVLKVTTKAFGSDRRMPIAKGKFYSTL